jgi:hypothetical protein
MDKNTIVSILMEYASEHNLDIREGIWSESESNGGKEVFYGNWNTVTRYNRETKQFDQLDNKASRIGAILEKLGFELDWSDEVEECENCYKLVSTSPSHYGWLPKYTVLEGGTTCLHCLEENKEEYLEEIEGDHSKAMMFNWDLEELGYTKYDRDFENGWYGGQNDSPEVVAESLRKLGINRFVFEITDVGQFDIDFCVWIHNSEYNKELLDAKGVKSELPYDPATEIGKALRGEKSDYYKTETRTLTPEEFVKGDWNK